MAPIPPDDSWSDSDDEERSSGIETHVLLGIPDGKIENEDDLIDGAVSRIGGLPALLPSNASFTSSSCRLCMKPMELLVQLWCPFENSPMDRALYVWGCALAGCQGKEGSVRAWRGLRYNETYAAKLKRKQQKAVELQKDKRYQQSTGFVAQKTSVAGQSNPFTMAGDPSLLSSPAFHNHPFSFGAHSFDSSILSMVRGSGTETHGDPVTPPVNNSDDGAEDETESDSESSDSSLITALASTAICDSAWKSAPSYPPLYLSTLTEYLPPQPAPKLPKGLTVEDLGEDGKKDKNIIWAKEKYEDSLELDQVFERFTQRVAIEGKQCIRYELGGNPLPFASDKVSDLLWPKPPSDILPTTKPDFKVVRPSCRAYNATQVPRCPSCNASRVFECQLMPNLINVLRPTWEDKESRGNMGRMTDEERRKQMEKSLRRNEDPGRRGIEWGTCLVFSCEKDCCLRDGKDVMEVWREEVVYVQWDI